MAQQVVTPGSEWQEEGRDTTPAPVNNNNNTANAEVTLIKFNKLNPETQKQLHRCYHSKKAFLEQFACGLGFISNEICYLSILIEINLCDECDNDSSHNLKFEKKQQENMDKIKTYFNEIDVFMQEYQQNILQFYKEKSQKRFEANKNAEIEIQMKPMKQALDALFTHCYEIIDSEEPKPPQIKVSNGDVYGLVIEIFDKDKAPNDKYEIVVNDENNNVFKKEFINDDNKQNLIELTQNIKSLAFYHIKCRRFIALKQRWSKYCTSLQVFTDVKFAWSKTNRGTNAKLSNLSRDVYCKSKNGSCSITADKSISSQKFKQVSFSFKMNSLAQFSYCGFVEFDANQFEKSMRPYWDSLVVKKTDSYCLGFCNGSNAIQRWVNGSKKGKSKWSKELKLQNGYKTQNGDLLLFEIDFEQKWCDVYLNEKKQANKICAEVDQHTFASVPTEIIPVYSHENNPYIIAHSKVSINFESYQLK